jgi:hypothetical protein
MKTILAVTLLVLTFCLTGLSLAQEGTLSITEMKAEPAAVKAGRKVLISCRVTDARGPMFVERVAATARGAERSTSYPMLFDDATNGDKAARDGVYSLRVVAPKTPGEVKVFFHAVSTDKKEVEAGPIVFRVK